MLKMRPAQKNDLPAIVKLVNSAYRGESGRRGWTTEADLLDGQRTDLTSLEDVFSRRGNRILVAERAGDAVPHFGAQIAPLIMGCVHLQEKSEGKVMLGMLTVDPSAQGNGVGDFLIRSGEVHAQVEMGAKQIQMYVITVRGELIAWYERRGYHMTLERAPFPYGDERFGVPLRPDLEFGVMLKEIGNPALGTELR